MVKKKAHALPVHLRNPRAKYDYTLHATYVAGLQLVGSEVKVLRLGRGSLQEAYCYLRQGELWVKQLHIPPYQASGNDGHDPLRPRKLLLQRRELKQLQRSATVKGHTIIPLRLFLTQRGLFKLEVALATGKKKYDKRAAIKEREVARHIAKHHRTSS